MKLLVSDYDGTLKRFYDDPIFIKKIDFKKDLEKISKFIDKGNIFVLSTKRSFSSIYEEIKKYNIPYTYLIVREGLVCFDKNGEIVFSNYLNPFLIKDLIELEKVNIISNLEFFNEYHDNENIPLDKVVSLRAKAINLEEFINKVKYLNLNSVNYRLYFWNNVINIKAFCNKKTGIYNLLSNINAKVNKNDIFTLGDSYFDMPMLDEFNGYSIKRSELYYHYQYYDSVSNVRKLIKKIK